ncbi:MAG: 4-hydroxy-3-methylbut-2-enyl diphosphate reductase [Treponema sp.]|nr:4-hydroxy-3-methylbut-2-enyl diphosphate reductase [Treponema sp.]MCL2237352.1 4-hydroxy-3-methylbut-2-enyl diphosphate reductase [Treponema sp.]
MKVIRAKVMGFCMGVRRAVEMTCAETQKCSSVYTFGPLIHNPKVLSDLESLGIQSIESLEQIPRNKNCSVVIRAHGIDPDAENELYKTNARIVDATCPNVRVSQLKAQEYARDGYCLFLAGESEHAEIKGIMGYAKASGASFCEAVCNAEEALKTAKKLYGQNTDAKTALLGQTTICEDDYQKIGKAIETFFPNLKTDQTICSATTERQNALRDLTDKADCIIIAGGKKSANTNRLLDIAKASGKPCVLAENSEQIPHEFFNYETAGLCAGASTPDSVIEEIENKLLIHEKTTEVTEKK